MNSLINVQPTLIAKPYNRLSAPEYSLFSSLGSGASISRDENRVDPMTGLAMAKLSIPSENTSYQIIEYHNLTPKLYSPDDIWMLSVYIPKQTDNLRIQILLSDESNVSGIHYRSFQWEGSNLRQGHHSLSCLQVENYIDGTTYGIVGTNINGEWINSDGVDESSQVKSISVRVKNLSPGQGDSEVFIGAIHSAPPGWAKSCIMWMADDVPASFDNLVIPMLDVFEWKTTLAITSQYSADHNSGSIPYISMDRVRDLDKLGHEIWGHHRQHEDATLGTDAQRRRALEASRDFWRASGIKSASIYMAWPFGHYDDASKALAKELGYKLCREGGYVGFNPRMAAVNPYSIPGFNMERLNSWQVDTALNGFVKRGESAIMYTHNVIPGGSESNTRPSTAVAVYEDHVYRWAQLLRQHEYHGRAIGTTVSGFYKLCGINTETDFMVE